MDEQTVIRTLRAMAWQRAKGELASIMQTYWAEYEKFKSFDALVDKFIKEVEDEGYVE